MASTSHDTPYRPVDLAARNPALSSLVPMSFREFLRRPARLFLLLAAAAASAEEGEESKPAGAEHAPPRIERVAESCYAVLQQEGRSNAGFVVGGKAVLAIDCLGSEEQAKRMLAAIREVTDRPVRYVALTHWHYDQIAGNHVFGEKASILAATGSAEKLAERLAKDRAMLGGSKAHGSLGLMKIRNVDETIDRTREIDLGGLKVVLEVAGECHSAGDLVVRVPDRKVLFAGDLVWNRMHPNIAGGSTFRWIVGLAKLQQHEIDRLVPGHGDVGTGELLIDQRHYLMTTRRLIKHLAKNEVDGEDVVGQLAIPEPYRDYGYSAWWRTNLRFIYTEIVSGR